MKTTFIVLLSAFTIAAGVQAREFCVAMDGNDANAGTASAPFRTIQRGADVAQPGDVIIVHEGVYRERVNPPRGGESDTKRIIYEAAPGERVEVRGSEVVTNWVKVQEDIWKTTLPNAYFGSFNPYSDLLHGDWFNAKGRAHHSGAVYLNGDWLTEAATLDEVLKPAGTNTLWFGEVDQEKTTIWAAFPGANPNEQLVEINKRRTVFYPEKAGINYLTVRGFALRQAATPWAPPTAEQIGLMGTHWSKGWIIESNVISHSICSGIALGKYGDEWDNKAESAEGYVGTIHRALTNGWNKASVGHHLVRNNTISHCEQAGIVGSLGAISSVVTGNTIHDIHVRRLFSGAEMAGIKFHAAIDVEISRNHVYRSCLGLWLDWMAQGARVSGNLFHDNRDQDLFVEVNHGPLLVDNNIFLSPMALLSFSQGSAYVHNLFAGKIKANTFDARQTPFHKAHSTEVAGLHDNPCGNDSYYNNLFVKQCDLTPYDTAALPVRMEGNVFLKGTKPCRHETNELSRTKFDPTIKLVEKPGGLFVKMRVDKSWVTSRTRKLVTSELLGKAAIPGVAFENPDGSPLKVDADFFGRPRNEMNPAPGPFEKIATGLRMIKVR